MPRALPPTNSSKLMKTALYESHLAAGGHLTDFAGWELPLHFGSQLQEHRAVRRLAGMFDVSHMVITDIRGPDARRFMKILLCNDVDRIERLGGAQYGCMLNIEGGIIDDVIVYRWADDDFRLVTNAATRGRVGGWLQQQRTGFELDIEVAENVSMLAIQGPLARELAGNCLRDELGQVAGALPAFCAVRGDGWQVARTGYTGEDGYEVIVPDRHIAEFWRSLLAQGVQPCGLAARDTLRLEAGLRLYGTDMDEETTPAEAGLAWTVASQPSDRAFIGRCAIEQRSTLPRRWEFAGLVLEEPGVLRAHQTVDVPGLGVGRITSGGYSPGLNRAIAFARLPVGSARIGLCEVHIRDRIKMARIRSPRFLAQ